MTRVGGGPVPAGLGRFSLEGRTAVVTGGAGVLGRAMAAGLAGAGADVVILGRDRERAERAAAGIAATGASSIAVVADVLDPDALTVARDAVLDRFGAIDVLVNAAGGNQPAAMVHGDRTFFAMPPDAFEAVVGLNLTGTLLPCQVLGEAMAARPGASIINISSMAASRVVTRGVGYSAAKAGVENLTRWLAVELAHRHGDRVRVNAIAPGFFLADQNRALLIEADGSLTPRGGQVIANTPTGRFGDPDELVGAVVWLAGDASRFVTGAVIPVDGGFSVYSGV